METKCTSVADAKAHIAKIRHDKGLFKQGPVDPNVSDLENALTTLSEQLYQSSTHFLLELIQNADDNSHHPNVQRSVEFTYTNGYLRIDCSEVGFSPRNVEALCRVGQSTKKDNKGGDNSTRYVGEKGIGFKSVFKAADVVWMSSGFYSFKFDKRKQLGMIAPIWADFPEKVKPGYTSLYLQLSQNYNQSRLLEELRSLDSRLLIFLRRLQCIRMSISEPRRKVWERSFSRVEIGNELIRLNEDGKVCDFIVKRHQVTPMPHEAKREGVLTSEIILGFPINGKHQPVRQSQQAYAFLPIRDYGFEFLIQADFLLIASREDIDESALWNHAIRDALPIAFLNTMKDFNKGELRYLWPRYLPIREPPQSFLKPFHCQLQDKLASSSMLLSQSGTFISPKSLSYVQERFTFNGAPMTINARSAGKYLSNSYDETDIVYLKFMRVATMTEIDFYIELTSLLSNSIDEFKAKSDAWHSRLAQILMGISSTYIVSRLPTLALIPLENGTWISANSKQILFPGNSAEFELPDGLELAVVQQKAAADPTRRRFFKILGVGELEQGPVVQHIQDLHKRDSLKSIPAAALVSQTRFLYAVGWKNPACQLFWFTSEFGQRLHGSQLYQDSKRPHSATKFFSGHRKRFPFVDKEYLEAPDSQVGVWTNWLEEKLEVATLPRLIQSTSDRGFEMSEDFKFIIKKFPSSDVLLLFRDHWAEYSRFFDEEKSLECSGRLLRNDLDSSMMLVSANTLKKKLRAMLVLCKDGKRHRLDTTYLPTNELLAVSEDGVVPFVDIPDAENSKWHFLELFGVSIQVDLTFYLRGLASLNGSDDFARVEAILAAIQFRCKDNNDAMIVKTFFEGKKLVYIPAKGAKGRHQWVALSDCRWKGPPPISPTLQQLKTLHCLQELYPGHKRLFSEILSIRDTSVEDLVGEAKAFATGDSLTYITSLFRAMEKMIEGETLGPTGYADRFEIISLRSYKIFPVSKNWDTEVEYASALRDAWEDTEWFIADTAPFRTIFAGVVPLLNIKVDDLAPIDQVLTELDLKSRFLSNQATSIPRIQGYIEYSQGLTDLFRSKIDFIIRLMPTNLACRSRRQEIIQQLRGLQVYTADEVIQEWCVTYKGRKTTGPPGNGTVALDTKGGFLKIYLSAKSGYQMGQTPMELVDEIFNYCGMLPHSPEHSEMCLHVALSQNNLAQIMKIFADKGIPSLESLKFADEVLPKPKKENDKNNPERKHSEGKGKSGTESTIKKSNPLKVAAGAVLAIPVGIAMGVGELTKSKKHFDGPHNRNVSRRKIKAGKTPTTQIFNSTNTPTPGVRLGRNPKGTHSFQVSISKGLSCLQKMVCPVSNENVAFAGELAVHKVLEDTVGENYNPRQHWTSKRRAKADVPSFHSDNETEHSCFKFVDVNGAFTQILVNDNHPAAKDWVAQPPTYHLDVKSTTEGIEAEFSISTSQFERAKDLSVMVQKMKADESYIPTNVYVLVRVYDIDVAVPDEKGKGKETAKMIFLVDPWECYHADKLLLRSKGPLVGSIA